MIELLRKSLGESTIPKSESLWAWKHEQNPFGNSYVLLAEENDMLIGLRAFMKWEWLWNGRKYRAIRAVDTATHPDHQGKGIFKKLTLQQAELCKQEGVDFVFNTPNEQSRPGYLKMGWLAQGRMPLKLKLVRPFNLAYARFRKKTSPELPYTDPTPAQEWSPMIAGLLNNYKQPDSQLSTHLSPAYINWRYADNPLFRYNYFSDNENYLLINRVKNTSSVKELRLVDFVVLNDKVDPKKISSHIKRSVLRFCREQRISIISLSGQQYQHYRSYFRWMGFFPVKPLGPIITVKDLNMKEDFPLLMNTNNWSYSLGDMELF